MKCYWTDDASRTGNKEMSQVSSPAGGLWCPLRAAIPHEAWDLHPPPYPMCAGSWGERVPGCLMEEQLVPPVLLSTWPQEHRPGCAAQHSAWVQCNTQRLLPSWGFCSWKKNLGMGKTGREWQFEEHWASNMLSAWGKYAEDTPVAFYGFKSSLVVFPCLQKKKERKRGIFCQFIPRLLSHGVRAVVLGSRHFCSSKDESQTK